MIDLKFDIYAMVNPKNNDDITLLMCEAMRLIDELDDDFSQPFLIKLVP